jgi:hypothetical protein
MHIVGWKERHEVRGLGRITAKKLQPVPAFEDTGDLIARHENRNSPPRARHPFRELPLGMGIRAIDFI